MGLFHKNRHTPVKTYDAALWRPVIRCSICTGEQTAGMKNRENGKFEELMLIRDTVDLEEFCRTYRVNPDDIRREY